VLTILLGCLTGMLLFWGMGLAWSGHLWAQIVAWFLGFFGVSVGVNLVIRRKLEAIFKDVQAHIELTQGQLRRRIAVMQNRNMGGGKAVQKLLEKDQGSAIRDAVTILDRVAPLKKWNLLAERQANTLKGQLYYQIKDFASAGRCLDKSLVPTPDPLTLAIKMALMYREERFDELEKAFRRGVKRFKDEKGVLLYGLYSWVLVAQERADEALVVLEEGKNKTENVTIKQNWEHLANGRVRHFSNAGLGEQWYALHLEEPKAVRVRQTTPFGGPMRRR
jgi:tetratricopeptide (TPR) repeat protein